MLSFGRPVLGLTIGLLAGASLAGSAGSPDTVEELMASLKGATVTDSDRYLPQSPVAGCPENRPDRTSNAPLAPSLQTAIQEARAYSDSKSGRALMVLHNGKILHESYSGGATADTHFLSYSLHKSVVGMTIAAAIQEGILPGYDAPLAELIDAWAHDPRGAITLDQAMSMETGLTLHSLAKMTPEAVGITFGPDVNEATLAITVDEPPETRFVYNNVNSQLAGIALSQALADHGKTYESYLSERIWCPVGNADASLWVDIDQQNPRYFAGIHATARDWAEVGEAFRTGLEDGTDFTALAEPSSTNPNYGRMVWLDAPADGKRTYSDANPLFVPHNAPYAVDDMVFFDGFGGQRVYVSATAGLTIVRFGEVDFTYDDAIIPNLILAALPDAKTR